MDEHVTSEKEFMDLLHFEGLSLFEGDHHWPQVGWWWRE